MKRETSLVVSMWHLMSHAEPVSPTRKVRRRLVAHQCMTNNDSLSTTQVRPYFYVTDYLGSLRMVCDGITGEVRQSLEYLPSGYVFRSDNYAEQPYMFCGKELVKMHDHQPKTSIHDRDLEILRTKIKKQKRAIEIENITDRPIQTSVKNSKSGY